MKISIIVRKKGELNLPLIYLLIIGGCILYVYLLNMLGTLLFLPCLFKKLTGCPCPTCGSTRLLQALFQMNPALAFLYNPLVFLAGVTFIVWIAYGFYMFFFKKRIKISITSKEDRSIRWGLLVIFIINWIYLIMAGI